MPQLVPDFLSPEAHQEVPTQVTHPASRRPVLFAPAQYALRYRARDPVKLVLQRTQMVCAVENLEKATVVEAHCLCRFAPPPTQAVLNGCGLLKNVLYMRDVKHVVGCIVMCIFADFVLDLPTVGLALHALTQVPRQFWPDDSINTLLCNAKGHNQRLVLRVKASSDITLDTEALKKRWR